MKNRVLVIATHPDDETLGCGGTLLKHKVNDDHIHWLICTNLNKNHKYYPTREKEIKQVSKIFNFNSVHTLPYETTKVDQVLFISHLWEMFIVITKKYLRLAIAVLNHLEIYLLKKYI